MEQKNQKSDEKKQNKKQEIVKKTNEIVKADDKIMEKTESSTGKSVETPKEKSEQIKKSETQKKKIQKNEAVVNIQNAPVSTKYSRDICKFIKYKQIEKAINDLEQVLAHKKAITMKGGVGHKKSAGSFASGSGKYPKDATEYFCIHPFFIKNSKMDERKTVKFKKDEFAVKEFIKKFVGKGKLSKVIIEYTPVGEKIIISTHKPGLLIGKGGEKILELTRILK